jgi:hypothetical protein
MVSGCFCPQEGENRGGLPGSRYRAWAGWLSAQSVEATGSGAWLVAKAVHRQT